MKIKPDFELTPEQNDHVVDIQREFCIRMREKYTKGAEEHGGNLINMPIMRLLDSAIEEAIDQIVYLQTLRTKLEKLME